MKVPRQVLDAGAGVDRLAAPSKRVKTRSGSGEVPPDPSAPLSAETKGKAAGAGVDVEASCESCSTKQRHSPQASSSLAQAAQPPAPGPSHANHWKVAVVGAAGGIGQPLSLLLKLSGRVGHLALFDLRGAKGVAADLAHINTHGKVTGHEGPEQMADALRGCDVVLCLAGVPRKPGMTRDDLFKINAGIVTGIAEACAKNCPQAAYLIISNPINSIVPLFAEVLKRQGTYDPRKLFGVTTLDVCRAQTFVAEHQAVSVTQVHVDVIGGHAGTTILPLLSQVDGAKFTTEEAEALTHRVQFGGDEVVEAKGGAGSATLSMAHAGAHFVLRVLDALGGAPDIRECAFVESSLTTAPFFSSPVTLGVHGVEEVHHFGELSSAEQAILDSNVQALVTQAKHGMEFVKASL